MRYLQNTVLLVGLTALGLGGGGLLAYGFLKAVFPEPRGENWGGAVFWLALIGGGCLVGLITGLMVAIGLIVRGDMRDWNLAVWAGITSGFAIGWLVSATAFDRFHDWFWAVLAAFTVSACSALGGFAGRLSTRNPSAKSRSAKAQGRSNR